MGQGQTSYLLAQLERRSSFLRSLVGSAVVEIVVDGNAELKSRLKLNSKCVQKNESALEKNLGPKDAPNDTYWVIE